MHDSRIQAWALPIEDRSSIGLLRGGGWWFGRRLGRAGHQYHYRPQHRAWVVAVMVSIVDTVRYT